MSGRYKVLAGSQCPATAARLHRGGCPEPLPAGASGAVDATARRLARRKPCGCPRPNAAIGELKCTLARAARLFEEALPKSCWAPAPWTPA